MEPTDSVLFVSFVLIGGMVLIFGAWSWSRAYRLGRDLKFYQDFFERSLRQLDSSRGQEVLTALQVIGALKEPRLQMRAVPRISELRFNEDKQISALAEATLLKIKENLGFT